MRTLYKIPLVITLLDEKGRPIKKKKGKWCGVVTSESWILESAGWPFCKEYYTTNGCVITFPEYDRNELWEAHHFSISHNGKTLEYGRLDSYLNCGVSVTAQFLPRSIRIHCKKIYKYIKKHS